MKHHASRSLGLATLLLGAAGCDGTASVVSRRTLDGSITTDAVSDVSADRGSDAVVDARADAAGDLGADVTADATADAMTDGPSDVRDAADAADAPDAALPLTTRVAVNCGTVCQRPLDAVPDSMGRSVYFTAFTPSGEAGVFRATIPGAGSPAATPTPVVVGMGLEFPVGLALSNDDATLFIADLSASRGMDAPGAVFSVPALGGTPSFIDLGATVRHPAAIAVTTDGTQLLVAGQFAPSAGDVTHALFRVARTGGTPTVLAMDLHSPSGLSQGPMGNVIAFDTLRMGPRAGSVVAVGASVSEFVPNLAANYPAGAALALDGRAALLSGSVDPAAGLLTFVDAVGTSSSPPALSAGMVTPLGLHRARSANVWAVADEAAGDSGQVFAVFLAP